MQFDGDIAYFQVKLNNLYCGSSAIMSYWCSGITVYGGKGATFSKIQRLIVMMNDSPGSNYKMITVERFGGGHRLDMKYSYPRNRVTRTGKQGK